LIEHLVNEARSYIYTTAMPPAVAAAARSALRRVIEDDWRREQLQMLTGYFKQGAAERGLALVDSDSPIQPLIIGHSQKALELAASLRQRGFLVVAIRPPTVPRGTARLRITLTAEHRPDQLDALLDAIEIDINHD
jgi:8-amino-7-oxononanoate synthase